MQHSAPPLQKPQGSLLLEDPFLGMEIGALRILELIGEGGFGAVYKAINLQTQTPQAIKILRISRNAHLKQTIHDRFQREADILQRIHHPHIVESVDFGQIAEGVFYLVMEFLQGESLHERLLRTQQLHPIEVLRWLPQLGSALDYIHQREIIHRDLKPENLFLHRSPLHNEEIIKLLDFGIASIAQESSLTQTGKAFGSPLYMSPEQVKGEGKRATAQTDIYSLGVILHEALTGVPPFQGEGPAIMFAHLMTPPPLLSDVSPNIPWNEPLERAIQKALAKDPQDRWPDIHSMVHAVVAGLQQLLQNLSHQTSESLGQITSPQRVISPFSLEAEEPLDLSYEDDDEHQHTAAMTPPAFSHLHQMEEDPFGQDEATIAKSSPRMVSFDQLPAAKIRASSTQEEIEVAFVEQDEIRDLDTSFDSLQLSNPIDPASGIELDNSFDSLQIHKMRLPLSSLPEVTGIRGVRPPLPPSAQKMPSVAPAALSFPQISKKEEAQKQSPPSQSPPQNNPTPAVESVPHTSPLSLLGDDLPAPFVEDSAIQKAERPVSSPSKIPFLLLALAFLLFLLGGAWLFLSSSHTTISSQKQRNTRAASPAKPPNTTSSHTPPPRERTQPPLFHKQPIPLRDQPAASRELPIPLRDQPTPQPPSRPTNTRPQKRVSKRTPSRFRRRKRRRKRKTRKNKIFEFEPKLSP